ncbi:hypothetical protein GSC20_004347 [Salmonella enterica]|nr:hypothetical protein [Salmonella enterica]EBW4023045.1 hypothetical protein [Salmonella enterica subsp. enterica serovar Hartford]EBW7489812.1 hypothetical protein [Salmonella enterica subsp. enterica serovar Enteritidis]ECI3854240.1 hypothetical protein [Salmonella enterica subsp. enterica]EBR7513803.1 hypothetical protein [Salmonella enterica]
MSHQADTSRNSRYQNQQTFLLQLYRFQRGYSNVTGHNENTSWLLSIQPMFASGTRPTTPKKFQSLLGSLQNKF